MLFGMPNIVKGRQVTDSLILERLFSFQRIAGCGIIDSTKNVYKKLYIDTRRRNFTMMCVPSLFHIAYGDRQYI